MRCSGRAAKRRSSCPRPTSSSRPRRRPTRVFRRPTREGWEAHHILEYQDCVRLGLGGKLPGYEDQICVLIPPGGHRGRINSILRRLLPTGSKVKVGELKSTYRLTYSVLGNYCDSAEDAIRFEPMQILEVLVA